MTERDIDQLTSAFAYAISALDAAAGNSNASLALANKAHQCWDDLLAEIERSHALVRAVAQYSAEDDFDLRARYMLIYREKARALLGDD